MTSVLTFGGLNYQTGNPIRGEFNAVRREIAELRNLVQAQTADIKMLKNELGKLVSGELPELASEKVLAAMVAAAAPPPPPGPPAYGAAGAGSSVPIGGVRRL